MTAERTRTHVVLPKRLVEEVDERVGQRRRSEFIAEATAEKLARLHRLEAAQAAGGSLANVDMPGWETPETATEWVTALRQASDPMCTTPAFRDRRTPCILCNAYRVLPFTPLDLT